MPSAAKSTLGQELMEDVRPDKTRTLVQKPGREDARPTKEVRSVQRQQRGVCLEKEEELLVLHSSSTSMECPVADQRPSSAVEEMLHSCLGTSYIGIGAEPARQQSLLGSSCGRHFTARSDLEDETVRPQNFLAGY
ncbi:hypothetical protein LR48_Vigan11g140900 [Vigna angularis]|uniref:Uncharacterized protein n=1 Tax=Phaseolus angularis TaxID=3914 RepID=A0A0L9VTH2_PHAAN|nr:hypothetical protein LR48_Vigan11g140900 [Vigna angularis]